MQRTGDDYFDSEEFHELLNDYENSVSSEQPIFQDADELTDIADYYHFIGEYEKADDAIELDNSDMTIAQQKEWLMQRFNEVA